MPVYENQTDYLRWKKQMRLMVEAARDNASPQVARNVKNLMYAFPWMRPGTTFSMAQMNLSYEDASQIAYMDLQKQMEEYTTKYDMHDFSDPQKKLMASYDELSSYLAAHDRAQAKANAGTAERINQFEKDRPGVGPIEYLQQQTEKNASWDQAADFNANNSRALHWGTTDINTLRALRQTVAVAANSDDPAVQQGVLNQIRNMRKGGPQPTGAAVGINAAIRGATAVLQSGVEAVAATARMPNVTAQLEAGTFAAGSEAMGFGGYKNVGLGPTERQKEGFAQAEQKYGIGPFSVFPALAEQTTLGQIGLAAAEGRRIDLGTGAFVNPESQIAKDVGAAARRYSPYLIGGHAWTAGRSFADAVGFEPDTVPAQILSGAIDAGIAITLDPVNVAFAKIGELNRSRNLFSTMSQAEDYVRTIELAPDVIPPPGVTPDDWVTAYQVVSPEQFISRDWGGETNVVSWNDASRYMQATSNFVTDSEAAANIAAEMTNVEIRARLLNDELPPLEPLGLARVEQVRVPPGYFDLRGAPDDYAVYHLTPMTTTKYTLNSAFETGNALHPNEYETFAGQVTPQTWNAQFSNGTWVPTPEEWALGEARADRGLEPYGWFVTDRNGREYMFKTQDEVAERTANMILNSIERRPWVPTNDPARFWEHPLFVFFQPERQAEGTITAYTNGDGIFLIHNPEEAAQSIQENGWRQIQVPAGMALAEYDIPTQNMVENFGNTPVITDIGTIAELPRYNEPIPYTAIPEAWPGGPRSIHGTTERWIGDVPLRAAPETTGAGHGNLFGPGLYTTADNPELAITRGYRGFDPEYSPVAEGGAHYSLTWHGEELPRTLNLDDATGEDASTFAALMRNWWDEKRATGFTPTREIAFPEAMSEGTTRYLDYVHNVLNSLEDGSITVGDAWNAIRKPGRELTRNITIAEIDAVNHATELARDDIFNNVLRRNYDALTHLGGGRVQDAIRHDVTIWINQDQLRAARIVGVDDLPEDPMDFIPHIGPDTIRTKSDLLKEAGAVKGRRWIINGKNPVTWLYGKGSEVVKNLANTSSPWAIYWALGGKVPIQSATGQNVLRDLAAATTESEVRIILSRELGTSIERIPTWKRGAEVGSRLWRDMPRGAMRWDSPDRNVKTLIDYMTLSKFDNATQERLFNMLIDVHGRGDQYAFKDLLFETLGEQLKRNGADSEFVDNFIRSSREDWANASKFAIDRDTGEDVPLRINVNYAGEDHLPLDVPDEVLEVMGPRWVTERLNSSFYLPDPDAVRRMVANPLWRKMMNGGINVGEFGKIRPWAVFMGLADFGNDAWKGFTLTRLAWPIRVVADELMRLAVVGDGPFTSPLSYIALVLGNPERYVDDPWYIAKLAKLGERDVEEIRQFVQQAVDPEEVQRLVDEGATIEDATRLAERTARDTLPKKWQTKLADGLREWRAGLGKYQAGISGDRFDLNDLYADALSNRALMTRGDRKSYLNWFDAISRTGPDSDYWARGLVGELGMANRNPMIQQALRLSEDEFLDALWNESWGRMAREQMAAGRDAADPNEAVWLRVLDDRAVSDGYGRAVLRELEQLHGGDQNLIDAILTGRLEGEALSVSGNGAVKPNPKAVKIAEGYQEAGLGPEYVRAQRAIIRTWNNKEKDAEQMLTVIAAFFDMLGTKPSNYLTRSPHFRLKYWDEIEKMLVGLNERGQQVLLDNLDEANLPKQRAARIRAVTNATEPGNYSWQQIDMLASQRALDHTRETLYDLHKKSQFFDAARLVMPFGEAWREMIVTWLKLVRDYPQVTNQAQKTIMAVKEAPANPITGLPAGMPDLDAEGNYIGGRPPGFWRFDSRTGKEVFTYPMSAWVSKAAGATLPMPMVGTTSGLNMLSQGLPGIGPVAQIAASKIIPNKPTFDGLRNILFPYGEPSGSNMGDLLFSSMAPNWMRKLGQVFADPRTDAQFGNFVMDVMAQKSSTGEYKIAGQRGPNDPTAASEADRLYQDSVEQARWMAVVRALGAFSLPSSPSFDTYVKENKSKPGGDKLVLLQQLRDDYQRLVTKLGYDEAGVQFIKTYGVDNIFARVPKSERRVAGLEATKEQRDWERTHEDIVAQYKNTWALFAPKGKEFDLNIYHSQMDAGYRDPNNPEEVETKGIQIRGDAAWDVVVASTGGDRANRAQLFQRAQAKKQLQKWYPGWTGDFGGSTRQAERLAELERAAEDPLTRDTPLGTTLREYFMLRNTINVAALQYSTGSTSVFNSKETAGARAWLFGQVDVLRSQNKNFARAWDEVLKKEFGDL